MTMNVKRPGDRIAEPSVEILLGAVDRGLELGHDIHGREQGSASEVTASQAHPAKHLPKPPAFCRRSSLHSPAWSHPPRYIASDTA